MIVDACDYYHVIREAMEKARHRILIIGWDFDPRIKLDRRDKGAEAKRRWAVSCSSWQRRAAHLDCDPNGEFRRDEDPVQGSAIAWGRAWRDEAIRFKLDSAHPPGCSHHQKIVVIDDASPSAAAST